MLGRNVYIFGHEVLVISLLLTDESLGLKGSNTTGTGRGDSLPVLLVLDVTSGEDTVDRSLGGTGNSLDVSIFVKLELRLDESSGGLVADSVEETVDREVSDLTSLGVLDGKRRKDLTVTLGLGSNSLNTHELLHIFLRDDETITYVPEDGNLGVRSESLGHDLGSSELVPSDEDVDVRTVLGEV